MHTISIDELRLYHERHVARMTAVFLSRGIPASRLTKAQAARMLGIAYNTLQSRYISRGKLHVGQDGKIALLALRRLMGRLDGKD